MVVTVSILVLVWMSASGPADRDPVETPASVDEPMAKTVEVLESWPHDAGAYTQGLLWFDGSLYESTGQYGSSTLRRVRPDTGEVLVSRELEPRFFGEGLARIDDRLIQLTWQEGIGLVWDRETLQEVDRFEYQGKGWGLCFDGQHLVMSDGSHILSFRDPQTFEVERRLEVKLRDGAVGRLNELECAEGWIYANVYTTDWIVQVDPQTGEVHSLIDASGLLTPEEKPGTDVLNGIAYDPESQVFYLTGKLWPRLFAVRFVARGGS